MEIKIELIKVYTESELKICILIGNTIIDVLHNVVTTYIRYESLGTIIIGNKYNDFSFYMWDILNLARKVGIRISQE